MNFYLDLFTDFKKFSLRFCQSEFKMLVIFCILKIKVRIFPKGLRDKTTLTLQNESDGSSRDHDEEANDCLKDRKNALEDKSVS